jgi:enamine deaminase RidA (YjgF/YER057c/UK114 family)
VAQVWHHGAEGEDQGWATALRVGERVLISGLVAQGPGSGAEQFGRALEKAGEALAGVGASLAEVVRTRVFHTRSQDRAAVAGAHGEVFRAIRPASTLTQVHFLPRGGGVLVELEAVVGSAAARKTLSPLTPEGALMGGAGLVQVGDELWLAGITAEGPDGSVASPGEMDGQSREVEDRLLELLATCGCGPEDVVSTRDYVPVSYVPFSTGPQRLPLRLMHPGHPTAADISVSGLGRPELGLLIEAEAVVGAARTRRNANTGRPYEEERHYSRSVRVGGRVYVSGCTAVQLDEEVASPFDAHGQTAATLKTIRWGVEAQGLAFGDLARLRGYVVGEENLEPVARALRETLESSAVAVTLVGVPALGRPSILVEIEALALDRAGLG